MAACCGARRDSLDAKHRTALRSNRKSTGTEQQPLTRYHFVAHQALSAVAYLVTHEDGQVVWRIRGRRWSPRLRICDAAATELARLERKEPWWMIWQRPTFELLRDDGPQA